ncbi:MAG: Ig-like domain-containing protein, partial [Lachnospiraceae bacterium]|nr:Ig-like domain-containing protein [Lachnospiraceae bacterium]
TSIKASKTSLVVYTGFYETVKIDLTTKEGGASYTDTAELYSDWVSSDDSIATVSIEGNNLSITAIRSGKVTVTGSSNDGTRITRKISVTVRTHPMTVSVNPVPGGMISVGKRIKLTAKVLPADTYNKAVTWSVVEIPDGVPKRNSVTINKVNGTLNAVIASPGVYTIRATAKDLNNDEIAVYDDYQITVTDDPVESLIPEKKSVTIFRKKNTGNCKTSESIRIDVQGGVFESLSVKNVNPGLVTAELRQDLYGRIFLDIEATANSTGKASLTVKAEDGSGRSARVTAEVINPPSGLAVSTPNSSCEYLAKGRSMKLSAELGTAYGKLSAASKQLLWESSNPDVISVTKNGTVKARSNSGQSAVITAKTTDGSNLTASVRVTSVANSTKIVTDGLWKRMQRTIGGNTEYLGQYTDTLIVDHQGYISLSNATVAEGGYLPGIGKKNCDIQVNKPGIAVKWSTVTREVDKPRATIVLYANTPGNYIVTIKMRDGSPAVKKIKVKVKAE